MNQGCAWLSYSELSCAFVIWGQYGRLLWHWCFLHVLGIFTYFALLVCPKQLLSNFLVSKYSNYLHTLLTGSVQLWYSQPTFTRDISRTKWDSATPCPHPPPLSLCSPYPLLIAPFCSSSNAPLRETSLFTLSFPLNKPFSESDAQSYIRLVNISISQKVPSTGNYCLLTSRYIPT
jgi:hypothetical protein